MLQMTEQAKGAQGVGGQRVIVNLTFGAQCGHDQTIGFGGAEVQGPL
ncbi:hypothetical protein [Pseudomonas auratipiscis]|uniref:Uncharacterized protein n=1 Tax=Pseudomonas auratipiscis TaxID=3115853 RepID=A0AB35WTS2_9PSED|nr:hypothetical protein [Pseudomonas sp. 120P]MEE1867832.1 hypothetical protein [Pseudomonas sp. 120P]